MVPSTDVIVVRFFRTIFGVRFDSVAVTCALFCFMTTAGSVKLDSLYLVSTYGDVDRPSTFVVDSIFSGSIR